MYLIERVCLAVIRSDLLQIMASLKCELVKEVKGEAKREING